jgi:hypothetical protein
MRAAWMARVPLVFVARMLVARPIIGGAMIAAAGSRMPLLAMPALP